MMTRLQCGVGMPKQRQIGLVKKKPPVEDLLFVQKVVAVFQPISLFSDLFDLLSSVVKKSCSPLKWFPIRYTHHSYGRSE